MTISLETIPILGLKAFRCVFSSPDIPIYFILLYVYLVLGNRHIYNTYSYVEENVHNIIIHDNRGYDNNT